MLVEELFHSGQQLILEKLGNLNKLKAGPLIKALFGSVPYEHKKTGEIRTRDKLYPNFSNTSEIVDVGVVKSFAELKKGVESASAFVVYLNGKAILLMIPHDLAARSKTQAVAYDKTAFETPEETEARRSEKLDTSGSDWSRRREAEKHKERVSDIVVDGHMTPSELKSKLETLMKTHGKDSISVKTIANSGDRNQKRWARSANDPESFEKFKGIQALEKRLSAYKLSKEPTAEDLEKFFKMALSQTPKIRYEGTTYQMESNDFDPTRAKTSQRRIFAGSPFKITYEPVPLKGEYSGSTGDKIEITMKFYPEELAMRPIAVEHLKHSESKKTKVYDEIAHIADKLGLSTSTKEGIVRHVTKAIESNANSGDHLVIKLEKMNLDWPEIESLRKKVNRALAVERLGALGGDESVTKRLQVLKDKK